MVNKKQSAYIEWKKQANFLVEEGYDNTFERVFDKICVSFNEKANYGGILRLLRENFNYFVLRIYTRKGEDTETYEKSLS